MLTVNSNTTKSNGGYTPTQPILIPVNPTDIELGQVQFHDQDHLDQHENIVKQVNDKADDNVTAREVTAANNFLSVGEESDISYAGSFPGSIVRYVPDRTIRFRVAKSDWKEDYLTLEGWRRRSQFHLFRDHTLWRSAFIELVGTFLLNYFIIILVCSILTHTQDYSYFPTAIAILHIPLIAFMILSTASSSGGHLNPMISFATCLAGLTEIPRMLLYIPAQILASILGAYTAKACLSDDLVTQTQLAMCSLGTTATISEALTLEIFCDLFLLFIAFGVALDGKQRQIYPPFFPPFVISITVALLIYLTGQFSPFSNGAIAFPTRCFGPAVAQGLTTADSFMLGTTEVKNAQWIYWVGPIISSIIIACIYRTVPPGSFVPNPPPRKIE